MPDAGAPSALTFYPAYCWTASPTYNDWVKLSAANVHNLKQRPGYEGQRLYFHLNHPIRYIRLVGLVTSFTPATETILLQGSEKIARTTRTPWIFTLDDGSGETIDVVCWRDEEEVQLATRPGEEIKLRFADLHEKPGRTITVRDVSLDGVELGSVVKVKGWVDEFRGRRQVLLERVLVLRDTAAEVKAWEELADFQRDVLARPWILTRGEVVGLRKREERRQRTAARREKKRHEEMDPGGLVVGNGDQERMHRIRTVPIKPKKPDNDKVEGTSKVSASSRPQASMKVARSRSPQKQQL